MNSNTMYSIPSLKCRKYFIYILRKIFHVLSGKCFMYYQENISCSIRKIFHVLSGKQHENISPGICFQQLNNMWMFEHVTYCGLSLQIIQGQSRGGGELGNINYLDSKFLKNNFENKQKNISIMLPGWCACACTCAQHWRAPSRWSREPHRCHQTISPPRRTYPQVTQTWAPAWLLFSGLPEIKTRSK